MTEGVFKSDDDALNNADGKDIDVSISPLLKQVIAKAKSQLDAGDGLPHQQVMEEVKNRFLKR